MSSKAFQRDSSGVVSISDCLAPRGFLCFGEPEMGQNKKFGLLGAKHEGQSTWVGVFPGQNVVVTS